MSMWPSEPKSSTAARRACSEGRSSMPHGTGARSWPPCRRTGGTSESSTVSCNAGSHGECCGGICIAAFASRIASTSTFRSVISASSSAFGPSGFFGGAAASAGQSSRVLQIEDC